MPLGSGDSVGRIEHGPRTARDEARESPGKRGGDIRIANRVEHEVVGRQLLVFFVGGVVDRVFDAAAGRAGQQSIERHIAGGVCRAEDQHAALPGAASLDKDTLDPVGTFPICGGFARVFTACEDCSQILAGRRDIRIELQNEAVPVFGDLMIAFHEVSGRDIAEIRGAGVGRRGGVGVQRVGGDQMRDGGQFVAVGAPRFGERAVTGRDRARRCRRHTPPTCSEAVPDRSASLWGFWVTVDSGWRQGDAPLRTRSIAGVHAIQLTAPRPRHPSTSLQQQFDRMKQAAQFRVLRARAFVDDFAQTFEKTRGGRTRRRAAA